MHTTRLSMLARLGLLAFADDPSAGTSGAGEGANTATSGTQAPAGQPNAPQPGQEATPPANAPQDGENDGAAQKVEDLPDWAQRIIREARDQAADARTTRNTERAEADARVKAILQAAGIDTGDTNEEDPVKAAADARAAAEQEARQARLELAVYRAASAANGDPAALLDSRAFLARAADLDPSDQEAVAGAIRDAIQDNPRLAVTQAATRSSADFTGGPGEGTASKYKPGMSIADGLAADAGR